MLGMRLTRDVHREPRFCGRRLHGPHARHVGVRLLDARGEQRAEGLAHAQHLAHRLHQLVHAHRPLGARRARSRLLDDHGEGAVERLQPILARHHRRLLLAAHRLQPFARRHCAHEARRPLHTGASEPSARGAPRLAPRNTVLSRAAQHEEQHADRYHEANRQHDRVSCVPACVLESHLVDARRQLVLELVPQPVRRLDRDRCRGCADLLEDLGLLVSQLSRRRVHRVRKLRISLVRGA